ncbi:hypothetical protein [Methylobacterium platani]|uniref:Uncharacterized protein n=2 Tax=Methylobacterium platani TaxID=427683 RepID=A0A179S7W1_9HYPH|nr:hypothetical protein [Methylobacterium platani]OAS22438.1 hypothetical protein A5481_18725 [Methylobacterium platani]
MDTCSGTPVSLTLGRRRIEGVLRAVGEFVDMPEAPGTPGRRLRNLILDFGPACAPVEVWLAEPEPLGPPAPTASSRS